MFVSLWGIEDQMDVEVVLGAVAVVAALKPPPLESFSTISLHFAEELCRHFSDPNQAFSHVPRTHE